MKASELNAYLTAGALRQAGSHAGDFCLRRARTVCGHEQPGLGRMSVTATVMSSVSFAPAWKQAWDTLSALALSAWQPAGQSGVCQQLGWLCNYLGIGAEHQTIPPTCCASNNMCFLQSRSGISGLELGKGAMHYLQSMAQTMMSRRT